VGRRHFEVAKILKEIPKDSIFTIRLVEPLKDGFSEYHDIYSIKRSRGPMHSGSVDIKVAINIYIVNIKSCFKFYYL
jgi:hypothetical protein